MANDSLKTKFIGILRKLERYTKTDMVYLTRGGFWSLSAQGVGALASFFVVLFLANVLTKESLGQYRYILSLLSLLSIFTLPGISLSLIRSVAKGNSVDLPAIAKAKFRFGLLGSAAALILAAYYFYNGNLMLTYGLLLSAIFFPFLETFFVYTFYFRGKQDFKTPAIYESISRLFQAVVILLTAYLTRNILVILAAFLIGQIIARLFFYKKTLRDEQLLHATKGLDESQSDDTIQYGKSISAISIFTTITNNMDILIVGHFLGPAMLAIYYVALSIPKNIVLIFNIFPRLAFPKFSVKVWNSHEYAKILRKLGIMCIVLLVPALIYLVCVPVVLPLFFKAYDSSVAAASILSLLIVASPLNAMVGQILYSRKFIKKTMVMEAISFGIFIAVFMLTYKTWGASGAATALVASEIVTFGVGLAFIR